MRAFRPVGSAPPAACAVRCKRGIETKSNHACPSRHDKPTQSLYLFLQVYLLAEKGVLVPARAIIAGDHRKEITIEPLTLTARAVKIKGVFLEIEAEAGWKQDLSWGFPCFPRPERLGAGGVYFPTKLPT